MLAIIRKKIEEGVTFFSPSRLTGNVLEKLTDAEQACKYHSVTIPAEDFMKFVKFVEPKEDSLPTSKKPVKTGKRWRKV